MSILIVKLPSGDLRYLEFVNYSMEMLTTDIILKTIIERFKVKTPIKMYHSLMNEQVLLTSTSDIKIMFHMQSQLSFKHPLIIVETSEKEIETEYDPTEPSLVPSALATRLSTPGKRKRKGSEANLIHLESELESENDDIATPKNRSGKRSSILRRLSIDSHETHDEGKFNDFIYMYIKIKLLFRKEDCSI